MKLVASALFAVIACSKGSDSKTTAASGDPATAALGTATFSVTIDGAAVSGGAIDDMQLNNAAHVVPHDTGNGDVLLYLDDEPFPGTGFAKHAVRLQWPRQIGAAKGHISISMQLDATHSGNYSGNAEITVTNLSATRVAGTFTTEPLSNSPDTPHVKPHIDVTGGTFDVPFATSKLLPP
jgi:hypothetical protein